MPPCDTCELSVYCRTERVACEVFLNWAGVWKGRGRPPTQIPTRKNYYEAFPADRGRLCDNTIKSFDEVKEDAHACA